MVRKIKFETAILRLVGNALREHEEQVWWKDDLGRVGRVYSITIQKNGTYSLEDVSAMRIVDLPIVVDKLTQRGHRIEFFNSDPT